MKNTHWNDNYKKVSVVMATYNGEKFVQQQLDSILEQTYPIYEIIIQDDGSTDKTWSIIEEYSIKYSFIKIYRTEKQLGPHLNFKSAFRKVTGDFIAPADQDDIWVPNKIESLIDNIGDKDLIFSQDIIRNIETNVEHKSNVNMPNLAELIWDNPINGHTILFRTTLVKQIDNLDLAFDYSIALVCMISGSYVSSDNYLTIWQRHEKVCTQSFTENNKKVNVNIHSNLKFLYTIFSLLVLNKSNSISKSFDDKYLLFNRLGVVGNDLELIKKICRLVSKQTLLSYIQAGYYFIQLNKLYNIEFNLKTRFFLFKKPFIFWHDVHYELYL